LFDSFKAILLKGRTMIMEPKWICVHLAVLISLCVSLSAKAIYCYNFGLTQAVPHANVAKASNIFDAKYNSAAVLTGTISRINRAIKVLEEGY